MPPITLSTTEEGAILYLVAHAPAELPAVLTRDLLRAWEFSRDGARARRGGPARAFRFLAGAGGAPTDLALTDRDARCWARAIDAIQPMSTSYGLSLCLRLLALVALLAENGWTDAYARVRPGATELDPRLLRLAAEHALDADARFDQEAFRAALPPPFLAAPRHGTDRLGAPRAATGDAA